MEKNELKEYEEYIRDNDPEYSELEETYGAISSFLTDYETLKNRYRLSLENIAENTGIPISDIEKIEAMKEIPSYENLLKLSKAVNGKLFISPMSDMTVSVPYEFQEAVRAAASAEHMHADEWLERIFIEAVKAHCDSSSFRQSLPC